ncbi:iron-containing redox enzyme family protein [Dongia sp.]|uniref:iron-containing redox enzyme family protein n=1 Tax=Dongia sp. TaxID=1977262 RepID=UPI0035B166C1
MTDIATIQQESDARRAIAHFAALSWQDEATADELLIDGDPFRRPTRAKDLPHLALNRAVPMARLAGNSALVLHRLLFNAYETDLLFLPLAKESAGESGWRNFDLFYGADTASRAGAARPHLENLAFADLEASIDITGPWSAEPALARLRDFLTAEETAPTDDLADPVMAALLNAADPRAAAGHYLVQMAPDFLSEASAMARLAPGAYGPLQSSLFNVLIDEYGAAVHGAKHSTLFEATLASIGLDCRPHAYWQFYQPGSLALANYFHYVAANKRHVFRYLGALFYTEASLVNVTGRQARTLRRIFGNEIDLRYFDEHHHIDRHHRQMVLTRLIEPAIATCGPRAIEGILRGFEEFRLLQELADRDLADQLGWAGAVRPNDPKLAPFLADWRAGRLDSETFREVHDERSTTHIHPDDRLLVIETGTMTFFPLAGVELRLIAGDALFIPGGRLHGSIVTSPDSTYHQPILPPESAATLWQRPSAAMGAA